MFFKAVELLIGEDDVIKHLYCKYLSGTAQLVCYAYIFSRWTCFAGGMIVSKDDTSGVVVKHVANHFAGIDAGGF